MERKFSEASQFYGLYCLTIFFSGFVILAQNLPLVSVIYVSQILNGLVLPTILLFILYLVNDRSVMRNFSNGYIFNVVAWISVIILIVLSLGAIALTLLRGIGDSI
ncbi:MAG: divalent metal cation transporter [Deltaproteobacteria bacterium]|nr:divalent metal cation transporter [Deltaproteobacteria bacterium]